MLKAMFKPFMKRFIGLFISMAFVSMLSIGLLVAFSSSTVNLVNSYSKYKNEYGAASATVTTGFTLVENLDGVKNVEGVEKVDTRLTIDSYLKKGDGRNITARIFTYDTKTDSLFKKYVIGGGEKSPDKINVSVTRRFAMNNGFQVGDAIKFGYFNLYVDANIAEIVEVPEAMYVRASNYIMSDNSDFGYVYVEETELNAAISRLARKIRTRLETDPDYVDYYKAAMAVAEIIIPDFSDLTIDFDDFVGLFTNQLLIKSAVGYTERQALDNVKAFLDNKGVSVKEATTGAATPYQIYMENCIRQITIASIFLPVFFYAVTMVVIILFMNQIIKQMTHEIGIMASIGIGPREIMGLFSLFTLIMTLVASVFGVGVGWGLEALMTSIMTTAYSLPIMHTTIDPLFTVLATVALIAAGQIATLISCNRIFRITPKDAMISNEASRKPIPKWLDRAIDKAPMNIKLGVNAIAQNPRRFFVSTFSIFAAFVMILITCFFYVAKTELISGTFTKRMTYDCQVYFTQVVGDEFKQSVEEQPFVTGFGDCYFTYLEVKNGEKSFMIETLALDDKAAKMIFIPDVDSNKGLSVKDEGVIIAKSDAERLGVNAGDSVTICGKQVVVTGVSDQYTHLTLYMSKSQMEALGGTYVSSFLINTNDEQALLDFLAEAEDKGLTVFTSALEKDLMGIFRSIDVFLVIMILFSLGMGFIILAIMSQNALMEQQRQISVLRCIGFTIKNVSDLWTLQSVSQFIVSAILAIPAGVGISILLFKMTSSAAQIYPFIFDWRVLLFASLFVLAVIVASHLIAMMSIKKWNLADNTRSRE